MSDAEFVESCRRSGWSSKGWDRLCDLAMRGVELEYKHVHATFILNSVLLDAKEVLTDHLRLLITRFLSTNTPCPTCANAGYYTETSGGVERVLDCDCEGAGNE